MKEYHQKRFSNELRNRIRREGLETFDPQNKEHVRLKSENEWVDESAVRKLSAADLNFIINMLFDEVSKKLMSGSQVIFNGWLSIFTNPTKRSLYASKKENGRKLSYAMRIRFKPLNRLRKQSETHLTETEYNQLTKKD